MDIKILQLLKKIKNVFLNTFPLCILKELFTYLTPLAIIIIIFF